MVSVTDADPAVTLVGLMDAIVGVAGGFPPPPELLDPPPPQLTRRKHSPRPKTRARVRGTVIKSVQYTYVAPEELQFSAYRPTP